MTARGCPSICRCERREEQSRWFGNHSLTPAPRPDRLVCCLLNDWPAFPSWPKLGKRDKYRTVLPGGESYETASPRVVRALQNIQEDGPCHVLIVSHEMIGRLLRMHLLALTPEQAMTLRHPQDKIYRIEDGQLTASVGGQSFQSVPPSLRP